MHITVLIHTHNEEQNIQECITSAKLLGDEILVIDMESTDKTTDIVALQNIRLHTFPFSLYVEPARAFGIEKAQSEWVFILDADERITPELANEIKVIINTKDIIQNNNKSTDDNLDTPTYYKVPRKNIFGKKKWLQHGGWWPDFQIRLINKSYFRSWPNEIHSTPEIEGTIGFLTNPITHYFHGDIEKMVEKTIIFEHIESDLLFQANKKVQTATFFRKFLGELNRRLIMHVGFLDGTFGVIESIYQAFSKTITYLYLYEKKNSSSV